MCRTDGESLEIIGGRGSLRGESKGPAAPVRSRANEMRRRGGWRVQSGRRNAPSVDRRDPSRIKYIHSILCCSLFPLPLSCSARPSSRCRLRASAEASHGPKRLACFAPTAAVLLLAARRDDAASRSISAALRCELPRPEFWIGCPRRVPYGSIPYALWARA